MIWWRGNGLWIGFLACLPAVSASALGATQIALAFAASAALIFMLRDVIGAQSALYSIPTRFWPPVLLVVAILVQFDPGRSSHQAPQGPQKVVANFQASLPRSLNQQIHMDRADIAENTLNVYGKALYSFDSDGTQQAAFEKDARKLYCTDMKALSQAKLGIAFTISVPPKTLSDRVTSQSLSLQPKDC